MQNRIEQIQEMLLKEPEDAFLNYALSLELAKKNEFQKAVSVLEIILKKDENYLAAYYQLGKLYESISNKGKAVVVYEKGIEVALKQKNNKVLGELKEALSLV